MQLPQGLNLKSEVQLGKSKIFIRTPETYFAVEQLRERQFERYMLFWDVARIILLVVVSVYGCNVVVRGTLEYFELGACALLLLFTSCMPSSAQVRGENPACLPPLPEHPRAGEPAEPDARAVHGEQEDAP
jgi:hypothetical protein